MLVVGELGHQVFRRAPAHGRGGSCEASVHAAVVPGELDADQLEQLGLDAGAATVDVADERSEEHTSELQSLAYLVCRLLLEKKKKQTESGDSASCPDD